MTTKLGLYNGSLLKLGERKLSSLTESREPRRVLDSLYDDGFVTDCLSRGYWNFAIRTTRIDYDPDTTPEFGYQYAFNKPSDYVRLVSICSDENFSSPLNEYEDEGSFWFSTQDSIYVRYVSNGASYGGDLSAWPETFSEYAKTSLARRACIRITASKADEEKLMKMEKTLLTQAKSIDASAEPTRFFPGGSWSSARKGRSGSGRFDTNGSSVS